MEKNTESQDRLNKIDVKMKKLKIKKIKVIQIAHASHSFFLGENERDLKKLILSDWYFRVAKQLKKFYPEIEVECWCPEREYKNEVSFVESEIKFRIFPTIFSLKYALDVSTAMLKALKGEAEKAKREGVSLVIHLHEYHNLHGLLISTFFKNEKIIAQHHGGSWPLKHLKQTKQYRFFFPFFILGQMWESRVLKNIDCFFALSQDEIDYLKKTAPNSKIRFQTMGVDDICFKKLSKNKARRKLNIGLKRKILIYIGRINEVKGIRYLLDAMKKLQDSKNSEIELKIIGFGPQEREFRNYSKKLNLKNTEFLGSIFGEEKLVYLSAADALVLPSSKEGAPVVIMEALARNIPVVVSKVGGTPLMIKNKREGVIINQENSDEIVRGINEILRWKDKNVKKYAKIYKWKKIIEDTVGDYENGRR